MCGIAGIVSLCSAAAPPQREALMRMLGALTHRGPDERGLYRDDRAGLAHARLSIIDISSGQQPLSDESGRTWIVFNGEIFNYVELRERLVALGYRFRTRSDTEVIVNAYRAWGEAAFERMKGQWAVAIWEPEARRLILSRDRTGICPLHFCERNGRLYFASEVKAIFAADAEIPRAFDPAGIDQTFTLWTVVPPQSVFQGITELAPGHFRIYENGGVRENAFWKLRYPDSSNPRDSQFTGSLDDAVEEVRNALESATSLRVVRSDVPVGSYLSGGLDSSLISAIGRRFAGERFQTFSLRFADAEYDETDFQRLMARATGSEHHEVTKCLRVTISFAREKSAASGDGSPLRHAARGCSNVSTPISSARPCSSGRWPSSFLVEICRSTWRQASRMIRAGAPPAPSSDCFPVICALNRQAGMRSPS